jgi:hypothetical protein
VNERSTGATDSQIEEAENRCEEGGQFNAVWIRDLAEYLVPPGYAIVPVSPVRADRDAVVEAIYAGQEAIERFVFQDSPDWYSASEMHAAYKAAEGAWKRIMNAIQATPEPERAE